MITIRALRFAAFGALVISSLFVAEPDLGAAHFSCQGSFMHVTYEGSEVECSDGYKDNICEAGCDFCFNTGCNYVSSCVPGTSVAFFCTNGS